MYGYAFAQKHRPVMLLEFQLFTYKNIEPYREVGSRKQPDRNLKGSPAGPLDRKAIFAIVLNANEEGANRIHGAAIAFICDQTLSFP